MTRSNDGWYTVYPKFTGITNLVDAKRFQTSQNVRYPYGRFDISWEYVNVDSSEIVDVRLYRAIGDFGRYTNPRAVETQGKYKLIASWNDPRTTEYSDDLKDLGLNGVGEGQYLEYATDILNVRRPLYYKIECSAKSASNGMCPMIFICDGNHVVALSTKAQVIKDKFYGEADKVWDVQIPNSKDNEVCVRIAVDLSERRSENKLRRVWSTTNLGRVVCFDYWDGDVLVDYFDPTGKPIYAMAVNPLNGDLLYHGGNKNLISVSYDDALKSYQRISLGSLLPESNVNDYAVATTGAVCTYESISGAERSGSVVVPGGVLPEHSVFFYVIVGREVVAKIDVTNKQLTTVIPRTHFGCSMNTIPNQNNVYGISNGVGQTVWANGHTPVHLYEKYIVNNGTKTQYRSAGLCRKYYGKHIDWEDAPAVVDIYGDVKDDKTSTQYALYLEALKLAGKTTNSWYAGSRVTSWCRFGKVDNSIGYPKASSRSDFLSKFKANKYKAFKMSDAGYHQDTRTVVLTSERSTDVPILQDIGYVYGCTSGINYDVSNGQIEDLNTWYRDSIRSGMDPSVFFSPITTPVSERGTESFFGKAVQGIDEDVAKPYLSSDWMSPPSLNTTPPSSQLGMAASIPISGSLSSEPYSLWQTNGLDGFVAKLGYGGINVTTEYAGGTTILPSPVYRFRTVQPGVSHFYTSSVVEKNGLLRNFTASWIYESLPFYAYPTSVDGTIPIYRYAGITDLRCHLFTSATGPSGYVLEGIGFYAYGDAVYGSKPVYRFNSKHGAGSFLTIDESEKANAISALSADWSYDGIAFYSYQSLFDGTSIDRAFKLDFPSYSSISGYVDGNEVDQITKFDGLFPTHVAIDDTNSMWVFCRGDTHSGIYKVKRNALGSQYPYGLSAVYTKEDKLFGNANNNTSDVIEQALLCKYSLSGYSAALSGSTFTHAGAVDYLDEHEFPVASNSKAYLYNKPAAIKYDYTGKYTKAITERVYEYKHAVGSSIDYEYNSNNTGIASIFVLGCVQLDPDYCHPDPTPPSGILVVTDVRQATNTVCDEVDPDGFWDDRSFISDDKLSASGYDNLVTTHMISALSMGGYQLLGTRWEYTDESEPVSSFVRYVGDSLTPDQALVFSDSVYHWNTPNVSGVPSGSLPGLASVNRNWNCLLDAYVLTYQNVYEYSEDYILGHTAHHIGEANTVDVYERWPTPDVCGRAESCGASEDFWGECSE